MGKRKSSSKPAPKGRKEPLSTTFKCLFCNHEKAVTVTLEKTTMFGKLRCKDCGQRFQSPINNLSAAVDVYADWVDACEDARLKQPPKERPRRNPDTLTNHGFAGGAKMQMKSNERDGEADAEGENDDLDSLDGRPAKRTDTRQERDPGDDDEEDDLDGPEERERAETRKKARANYSDEEDE